MIYRGAFHAHSKHSYDGQQPLPALCAELRRRGDHFLLLTEHDDTLDAAAYERIRAECAALSDAQFLAVPGLEIRCWRTEREQWHIAALGVGAWIPRGPIPEVVENIRRAGGLSVFLHPHKYSRQIELAEIARFDGLELWNGKEDGHFAPRWRTLRLARAAAAHRTGPVLYCGHDLHDFDGIGPLALEIETDALTQAAVLSRLRDGNFMLRARGFRFPAARGPNALQSLGMLCWRGTYESYRALRRLPLVGGAVSAARRAWRPSDSGRRPEE
ncbi:MAG: hypothetical protein HY234_02565 [Acidobacteria bacterium]|nr:hypothetical protein [Acidobacteriota bacterium]MBI3661918.1 hypothetical protein [Acidobacteriota bacterium]